MTSILLTGSFPNSAGIVAIGPSVQLTDTSSGEVIPVTPVPYWLNSASRFVTLPLRNTDDPDIEPPSGFWSYLITISLAGSPPQSLNVLLPSALGPTADLSDLVPVTPQPQVSPVFPYLPIPAGTASPGDVPVATGTGDLAEWTSFSGGFTTAGTGLSGSGTTVSLSAPVSVADGGTGATSADAALTSLGAASASALTGETSRAEAAEAAALQQSASLSDLSSASAARANLGLGTAATQPSSAFDAAGTASSQVTAETSRAEAAEALLAPKASPALTGTPTAPTASALTGTTQIATTAYADAGVAAETTRAETAEALLVPLSDLPLSLARGGTGQTSQASAVTALTGTQSAGHYLRSDGTNASLAAIQAADVPTLNQSTTGTAANITDTLDQVPAPAASVSLNSHKITSLANGSAAQDAAAYGQTPAGGTTVTTGQGGTGQVTRQAAINALTGSQSAGKVLRSDGTNATLSTIQSADVPTLNQSTTGTAAGLSSTLAIGSGGTGQVTQQAAINALTGTQSAGRVLRSDGTNATLSAIQAADVPTLNQSTSGTAAGLSATLAIASGGTGQASASAGFNALSPLTTSGDTLYGGTSGAGTRLPGNTTATKNFYTQTGTGSASAAPAWGTIASGDLPAATTGAKGAVILDGTATDIQPDGTISAGSSGNAADAHHVHPENLWWTAADAGFLAMNFDPGICTTSTAVAAGWVLLARVNIRQAITATNVSFLLATNASGSSTGTFAGLYSSSGTLLSGSSDIASSLTSGATKLVTTALTTPQALSAGTYVYTAIVSNMSSTQPTLARGASIGFFNLAGTPSSTARFASYSTGSQVSLPSPITTSTQFSATNSLPLWTAIS